MLLLLACLARGKVKREGGYFLPFFGGKSIWDEVEKEKEEDYWG